MNEKKKKQNKTKQNKKQCLEGQLNRVHLHEKSFHNTPHRQISIGQVKLLSVFKAFSREIRLVDAVCSGGVVVINNSKVYLRKISSVSTLRAVI